MKFFKNNSPHILFCLILFLAACTTKESNFISVEDIPSVTPEQLTSFDHVDSLYYSYLGINSFTLENGDFILPVWGPPHLVRINTDGKQLINITKSGRGPGEFLDIGRPTVDDEFLYIYDQFQNKAAVLDKYDLTSEYELVLEPFEDFKASRVYPQFSNKNLPIEFSLSSINIDRMHERLLIILNSENQKYSKTIKLEGKPYAPLGDLINGQSGSAVTVPFSDNQFIVPVPERRTLLMYNTRSDLISEINSEFDTVNTIPINLPTEQIIKEDIDQVKVKFNFSPKDWKYVEPWLPEVKSPADDMLYNKNYIWLKSNLRSENDIWFVVNMNGNIVKQVKLPKNSWLTHVSDHHLGVRLDDVTFALYEPVDL